ncbi:M20/M25/M40 family metallo-hydrolase [uncultured Thiodictyon sp.]|uniref:M20/M25/M40 family metallo-hydrolase n=1 Tax=uncultured Thiodictyon sp. TaxID=1846217 RepID=UPI0025FC6FAD|nr:M20/M25/M40 family metallo-hydrolase [uncultured Thiodictyon sp.]
MTDRIVSHPCVPSIRSAAALSFFVAALFNLLLLCPPVAAAQSNAGPAAAVPQSAGTSLARIAVAGPITAIGLPIYAHLRDALEQGYVLTIASPGELEGVRQPYQVLDTVTVGATYIIARERRRGARAAAASRFELLMDDGLQILLRDAAGVRELLAEMGFAIALLPSRPLVLEPRSIPDSGPLAPGALPRRSASAAAAPYADPRVAALIAQIKQEVLYDDILKLSGKAPMTIGGSPYTITTRYTGTTDLEKANQYIYEQLTLPNMAVVYQDWQSALESGRNIIATLQGKARPNEIVLVTAHLDDVPKTAPAPGADDNASGVSALLSIARAASQRSFDRTLRFAVFGGEEGGQHGSDAYAQSVATETISAVYNMDMVAWDSDNDPVLNLHTRPVDDPGFAGDKAIADVFVGVAQSYGLSGLLKPVVIADGSKASDHISFWSRGFAALFAIEDDKTDWNPNYHSATDTPDSLNKTYMTNYARASAATVAHLAYISNTSYTINTSAVPAAAGSVTCTPNPVPQGSSSTCTAKAGNLYRFGSWGRDCAHATTATCTLDTVLADKTVIANFVDLSGALPGRGGWRAILGR